MLMKKMPNTQLNRSLVCGFLKQFLINSLGIKDLELNASSWGVECIVVFNIIPEFVNNYLWSVKYSESGALDFTELMEEIRKDTAGHIRRSV